MDTTISSPPEDKGPMYNPYLVDIQGVKPQQYSEMVTNHFQGMELNGNSPLANYMKRKVDSITNGAEGQPDLQSLPNGEDSSQKNEIRDIVNRNGSIRL